MFTRRFAARLSSTSTSTSTTTTFHRPLSITACLNRAPALSDIKPEQGHVFDQKQQSFRANLADLQRQKKQRERMQLEQEAQAQSHNKSQQSASQAKSSSSATSPPTPASFPTADSASESADVDTTGMGSLSSSAGEANRQPNDPNAANANKKNGPLRSLIYGTEEGREMDREIERSFSQVLARGKYVHSIVFHEVKPDKVDEYTELVGSWYPRMAGMPENKVNLVGSWRTEVGECDTFGMLVPQVTWPLLSNEPPDTNLRRSPHLGVPTLHRLPRLHPQHPEPPRVRRVRPQAQDPHQLQAHEPDAGIPLLAHLPAPPARRRLRAQELHSAPGKPARVGDALAEGSRGTEGGHGRYVSLHLETRYHRQVDDLLTSCAFSRDIGVGAWFVQIGALNEVHHLWQFADLEERRERREQSWSVPGWGETVHRTVPLIQTMKSRIMVPCPWSPIG